MTAMTPQEKLALADEIEAKAEDLRLKSIRMRATYPWAAWLFDFMMTRAVRAKADAAELRREAQGEFRL